MAFRKAILSLKLKFFGIKGTIRRLKRIGKKLNDFNPVARRIVTQLLKEVDKPFAQSARGNPPSTWKRLSALTIFIRMNRSKRKNKDPKIMVDSGILRASNLPFIRKKGREFGVENRHPAAKLLHDGGTSKGNSVSIGAFRRKSGRVRPFNMRIKGGHKVPARPWIPSKRRIIQIIQFILGDFEKGVAKA